ncbi:MAG TPA: transporter [Gemmatimonadota bacterium]|jgi:hypothetical protein
MRTISFRFSAMMAALLLVPAFSRSLHAQATIATDRPGLAFSSITVPRGALQIEIGTPQIERVDVGGVEATTTRIPFLAVRYGVTERIELRAISPIYNHVEIDDGTTKTSESGNGDLELGAKVHLRRGFLDGGSGPDLSLIGSVFLPVGDAPFTISDDREGYAVNGVAQAPAGSWTLTGVVGANYLPLGEDSHVTSANLVGWVGRSLTSRVSGYVEAGWFPSDADTEPAYAGAGVAFLATPLVQLDAFFDRGLNDDATDWIFGGGVSLRLGGE